MVYRFEDAKEVRVEDMVHANCVKGK